MTTGVAITWHAAAEKTSKSLMFHLSAPSDKRMDSLRCICAIRAAMLRQGCPSIRVVVKRKPATHQTKNEQKKKGRCKNMVHGGGGLPILVCNMCCFQSWQFAAQFLTRAKKTCFWACELLSASAEQRVVSAKLCGVLSG